MVDRAIRRIASGGMVVMVVVVVVVVAPRLPFTKLTSSRTPRATSSTLNCCNNSSATIHPAPADNPATDAMAIGSIRNEQVEGGKKKAKDDTKFLELCQQIFTLADKDNDSVLDYNEFWEAFSSKTLNLNLSDVEMQELRVGGLILVDCTFSVVAVFTSYDPT
jgi:hypothetical protein